MIWGCLAKKYTTVKETNVICCCNLKLTTMNLFQTYKIGGPYMHLISLLALVVLGITILKAIEVGSKKKYSLKLVDLVLLSGSLAVVIGLLSQIIGIVQALDAISAAGDISPSLVMEGAKASFYAPIWGLVVFIFSLVFYFALKEIIKTKNEATH